MDSQEDQSESPNLRIRARSSPGLDLELASLGVVAIAINTAEQKLYFVRLQEAPCGLFRDLLREVDNKDVAEQTDADCQNAFDDENPSPAVVTCYASLLDIQLLNVRSVVNSEKSYHLLKTVSKHAGKPIA